MIDKVRTVSQQLFFLVHSGYVAGFNKADLKTGGQTLQCLPLLMDMKSSDTSLDTGGGRLTLASFNYHNSQQLFGVDSSNEQLIRCAVCDTLASDQVKFAYKL